MKTENRVATVLLIAALISLVNASCGSSASSPPPPPASITISMSPAMATVQEGLTQNFTASVKNDPANKGVTWTLSCAISTGCGSLSATSTPSGTAVTYTALGNTPLSNAATVTLTATSAADTTKSASAEVTIPIPPTLTAFPTMALTHIGSNVIIAVQKAPTDPSTWNMAGCSGGTGVCGSLLLPTGGCPVTSFCFNEYAAPTAPPPGGEVTVVATSGIDPTISATTTVAVSPINFTSTNYPAGNAPQGVAVADFNGDGLLDIAVADYGNPSASDNGGVSILLGNGDGTFQAASLISAGMNPITIAAGDFNGDGKPDLIVSDAGTLPSGGSGNLAILLGNGDGTFQAPITINVGVYPYALALGDFNQDGKLDIAVTDFGSPGAVAGDGGAVYVLLGNGNGTFKPPVLYNGGAPSGVPISVVARDFNGDGKLDLAIASSDGGLPATSNVGILLGNGDGTFQPAALNPVFMVPTSLAAGDLNDDGRADLALSAYTCPFEYCASSIQVLLGNGDGSFQSSQDASLTYSFGANNLSPQEESFCSALGFQHWRGIGICLPSALQVAEFDGSGKVGLVGIGQVPINADGGVFVMPGNGDGTFEGILAYPGPTANIRLGLALGDFNGDSKLDIVVANYDINGVTVLLNQTTPSEVQSAKKRKWQATGNK